MIIDQYLENKISFHGSAPEPDENGISYYFLAIDATKPKQTAKEMRLEGKEGIVKALHYKNLDHDQLMDVGLLDRKYGEKRLKEKPSVAGIHLSHSLALKHFLEADDKSKWAFIMEEDVSIPKGGKKAKDYLVKYLKDAASALPKEEPQLHYVGHCFTGQGGKRIKGDVMKKTGPEQRPRCRHAYAVNKAGAKKLLESSWPMTNNGDEMWATLDFVYFSDNDSLFIQDWQVTHNPESLRKKESYTGSEKKTNGCTILVVSGVILCLVVALLLARSKMKKAISIPVFIVFVATVSVAIYFTCKGPSKENMTAEEKPFLVTHWHDRNEIPPEFQSRMEQIQRENPEFRFKVLDNQECLGLLNERQKRAFHKVAPAAFKSDICRYAFMKDNQGIYYDLKLKKAEGAPSLFEIYSGGHEDGDLAQQENIDCILNGFLISKKKRDPLISKALDKSVENIEKNYYGEKPTSITGPHMLYLIANADEKKRINLDFVVGPENISFRDKKTGVDLVYSDRQYKKESDKKCYRDMWNAKTVYNDS